MPKEKANRLYKITFKGQYIAAGENGTRLKPYEIDCFLDDELVNKNPVSVFKNDLAPELMPKKYADYQDLATHEVGASVAKDGKPVTNLMLFNREDMVRHIGEEELPIEHELHQDAGALRTAINDFRKDPQAFLAQQEKLHGFRHERIARKSKALSLQEQFEASDEPEEEDFEEFEDDEEEEEDNAPDTVTKAPPSKKAAPTKAKATKTTKKSK